MRLFIKSLDIYSKKENCILRKIVFKKGVNLIVDAETSKKHNKVGKTTCLKLIDLSLGAKNKNAIYIDYETQSINEELMNFIEENKVYTELVLVDDFQNTTKEVSIKTELFKKGNRYLNGEKISYDKLNNFFNNLFFDNLNSIPPFRNLIKSFVRILMTKDNNQFLKVLENYGKTSDYRALYNYLFEISNPLNDMHFGNLRKRLSEINKKEDNSEINLKDNKDNESILEEKIKLLELEIKDFVDKDTFEKNRNQINLARVEYEKNIQQLNRINFEISQLEQFIEEEQNRSQRNINNELIADFFEEVSKLIPGITRDFYDLVEFNNQLIKNNLSYFNERQKELFLEKNEIENNIRILAENNFRFITLLEKNKVDLYYEKLKELNELKNEILDYRYKYKDFFEIEEEKKSLKEEIAELERENEDKGDFYKNKLNIFNSFFKDISYSINKEKPIINYNNKLNQFPLSIGQLSEGTSTGTRKSLIASYDIAYQLFARTIEKKVPKFIVHDVLESIEGEDFKELVNKVEESNVQYISAILKEKLISSNFSTEKQNELIILELSMQDRLFERKNDL